MAKAGALKKNNPSSLFLMVKKLADPESGELIGCLVPASAADRQALRERQYRMGDVVRAELKKVRNDKFFGLAHILGAWLAENVEGFELLSAHDALKKLQSDSGIGIIKAEYKIQFGMITKTEPERLNFFEMDEGRFSELWDGWISWLRINKWGGMAKEQVDHVENEIIRERQ